MQRAAKGSSEREVLELDPWALEKIQQDGLSVLGQKNETLQNVCNVHGSTSFHLITECTRQHESNIKTLTLNTAQICSKQRGLKLYMALL